MEPRSSLTVLKVRLVRGILGRSDVRMEIGSEDLLLVVRMSFEILVE